MSGKFLRLIFFSYINCQSFKNYHGINVSLFQIFHGPWIMNLGIYLQDIGIDHKEENIL